MILIGNGFGDNGEVEGKGVIGVAKVDEIVDVFLFFKEVADVEDGFGTSRGL